MSLTVSLYTSLSALQADQGAIAVTSNNIANVNTPGYSRQVADLQEGPVVTFGNLQFGTGVDLASVQGVRDNVLQLRLDQQAQTQGQLNTFVAGMNEIQPVFNEAAGSGLKVRSANSLIPSSNSRPTRPTSVCGRALLATGKPWRLDSIRRPLRSTRSSRPPIKAWCRASAKSIRSVPRSPR
jgi:hypothetical protein